MGVVKDEVVPYVVMVVLQFAMVGLVIESQKAMQNGMTNFTCTFYANLLTGLILLPSSFLIHDRSSLPPLTFSLVGQFCLIGLLGFLAQAIGYTGIQYASASLATAMMNLIPGFTFIFAIIFRMEKVDCRSPSTLCKFMGTVLSIVGALVVTLYNGPQILKTISLPHHFLTQPSNQIIGGLILVIDAMVASGYAIAQALVLKKYPAELFVMLVYCCVVASLSAAASLITEKDLSSWSLQSNTRLIAVIYSGLFGPAFQATVCAWCISRKGPLFVAMFHPLGLVIATAMGIIFLGDAFYLGSLVGSILIVIGFYSVMWGKAKERKMVEDNGVTSLDSTNESPLLKTQNVETSLAK